MKQKAKTLEEFRRWVKVQIAMQDTTATKIAKQLGIPNSRISEALHGNPYSKKYRKPLVIILGGDPDKFENII